MRSKIIKIGNSRGVRIPKPMIDEAGLAGTVELQVRDGAIVIWPVRSVREGWKEEFQAMAANQDDSLLDGDQIASTIEEEDWEW
jgi:antitoxin MazE